MATSHVDQQTTDYLELELIHLQMAKWPKSQRLSGRARARAVQDTGGGVGHAQKSKGGAWMQKALGEVLGTCRSPRRLDE